MYRTHTCGELRSADEGKQVTLAGWVQRIRNFGGVTFIALRDRYGIIQLALDDKAPDDIKSAAEKLGREFVVQAEGKVIERSAKNPKMPTGDIEIALTKLVILGASETPPFTIEDDRTAEMKYE